MINAFTYIIENDTNVQPLLGLNAAEEKYKVYPVVAPSSEKFPYITCAILSAPKVAINCGYMYSIQVSVYHQSYDEVGALADAVRVALEDQAHAGQLINGVQVGFINYTDISDAFTKGEQDLYVKLMTFEGVAN